MPRPSPPGRVVVAGLGPAGAELLPTETLRAMAGASRVFIRTERHPAVEALRHAVGVPLEPFDRHYEVAERFDDVYSAIVEDLVAAASGSASVDGGYVGYAVPGSPLVAERSVSMLCADGRVEVSMVQAPSFLDLAWQRLGIDPLSEGVRLVDASEFARQAAGAVGPLLVGQCHERAVLSAVKLAVDDASDPIARPRRAVLLHHLGLPDERVVEVDWEDLDRTLEPDHLTALWIPELAPPVAGEIVALEELVRVLRARCPWDREQTHGSLARHLLEESYEALEAIEALDAAGPDAPDSVVQHLEEELGDLLFQVLFHARLAAEEGRFTLADVARRTHDKLVARHPHVFADAVADTPEEVAARWEVLKKAEKGRASVTEGIPAALPALALAAKLQRKAESVGMDPVSPAQRLAQVRALAARLGSTPGAPPGEVADPGDEGSEVVGELLFAVTDLARRAGVDPETALRARAGRFRREVEASE